MTKTVSLCPGCDACPAVEIDDREVRIGEGANLAKLTPAEWNALVRAIRDGELTEVWAYERETASGCPSRPGRMKEANNDMRTTTLGTSCETARSDWARDRRVSWVWPAAFVAVGVGWWLVPGAAGSLLAAAGFAVAGALCVGNAIYCRRVHCAVTGPLYLVAAALFAARAAGLGIPSGWIIAGSVGGTAVAFVPEWLGTLYFNVRPKATRGLVAVTGALAAAGLVAACCLGPTLFVVLGVSIAGLGALGALEPYRGLFLAVGLGCWFLAYRQRRRATVACADDTCGTPTSRRLSGVLLWGSLAALVAATVYPYVVVLLV